MVLFLDVYNLNPSHSFLIYFGALYHSTLLSLRTYFIDLMFPNIKIVQRVKLLTPSFWFLHPYGRQHFFILLPIHVQSSTLNLNILFIFNKSLQFFTYTIFTYNLMEYHPHLESFPDIWNSYPLIIEMFFFFDFVPYPTLKHAIEKLLTSNLRFFFSQKSH